MDFINEIGYQPNTIAQSLSIGREPEFLKLTEQFNFAGLILITAQEESTEDKLKNMEMPKVLVNRILPHYTGDSVLIDDFQAGYQATMHLIEPGHRRIGFIKGPGVSSASSQLI